MIVHPKLKDAIEDRLKAGWSPEQIAGRPDYDDQPVRVSHETICAYVYSREGQSEQLARHLPSHRKNADRVISDVPEAKFFRRIAPFISDRST